MGAVAFVCAIAKCEGELSSDGTLKVVVLAVKRGSLIGVCGSWGMYVGLHGFILKSEYV